MFQMVHQKIRITRLIPFSLPLDLLLFRGFLKRFFYIFYNFLFIIYLPFDFKSWVMFCRQHAMNMATEIEFAQKHVPTYVSDPLENFPFSKDEARQAREEKEFVERYFSFFFSCFALFFPFFAY